MVYTIGRLECVTYQCYFINVLFDIVFLKGVHVAHSNWTMVYTIMIHKCYPRTIGA